MIQGYSGTVFCDRVLARHSTLLLVVLAACTAGSSTKVLRRLRYSPLPGALVGCSFLPAIYIPYHVPYTRTLATLRSHDLRCTSDGKLAACTERKKSEHHQEPAKQIPE